MHRPPSILVIVLRILGAGLVAHGLFRSVVSPYDWLPQLGPDHQLVGHFMLPPTYEFFAGAGIWGLAEWINKMQDQMRDDTDNAKAKGTSIVQPEAVERELERMRQDDLKSWHRDRESSRR